MTLLLSPFPTPTLSSFHSNSFQPRASSTPSSTQPPRSAVVVIGGGLAGLAAATHLHSANIPFQLLESSDAVGGRVRTDLHGGFLLDRGFQIFLTAYPETQRLLDYETLDLNPFYPGALIYLDNSFHRVADPFRRPIHGLLSLSNPIGTIPDKIRIGLARIRAALKPDYDILTANETTIIDRLIRDGFTGSIVDRFFRPFFGGIFFDRDLVTTSRLFDFVFKVLALGENALPSVGIAAIPMQLAGKLPPRSVRLNCKVDSIDLESKSVVLESGENIYYDRGVIVAVEQPEARRLLPGLLSDRETPKPGRGTACLYFSAGKAPIEDPILILNGSGEGLVNNMFFPTNVAPSYGPEGKVLVSVSTVGTCEGTSDEDLTAEVVRELKGWFGDEVGLWEHIRTYRVGFAQPDQTPPTCLVRDPTVQKGVYVCGDHWSSATFDGALVSGRRAAEALISQT